MIPSVSALQAYNNIYGTAKVAQTSPQMLAQAASYKSMVAFDALANKPGDIYSRRSLLSAFSRREVDDLVGRYSLTPTQLADTRKLARMSAMAIVGDRI